MCMGRKHIYTIVGSVWKRSWKFQAKVGAQKECRINFIFFVFVKGSERTSSWNLFWGLFGPGKMCVGTKHLYTISCSIWVLSWNVEAKISPQKEDIIDFPFLAFIKRSKRDIIMGYVLGAIGLVKYCMSTKHLYTISCSICQAKISAQKEGILDFQFSPL